MKSILVPLFIAIMAACPAYGQLNANLSGNPLVTTGWSIGGDAVVADSTVNLTIATGGQSSYVYYDSAVDLAACAQFSVKFDYQMIISPGTGPADGIAFFYIATPPSGFVSGGGLGLPDPLTGIVFTLDTWDNDGDLLNPESELYGYTTPSVYAEANRTQLITTINGHLNFMDDGTWHHCEIDYNAGNINVYYDYNPVAGMTGFFTIPITSGYFGFSASTGAAFSTQSIANVHIAASGAATTPTVSSPVVYCQYSPGAALTATGAGPFEWYTTDTATVVSLPSAPVPSTTTLDTAVYFVRQGTGTCISAPDSVTVIISPLPGTPVITGDTVYCTGDTFIPFTVTGTGTIKWYTVSTGGTGATAPPIINTTYAGSYTFYASETVNGCEGPRASIHVTVHATPPVPALSSGLLAYCQYAAFVPMSATGTNVLWFTAATGGAGTTIAPIINTAVSDTYTNYVQQSDSGCTSPRGPITVQVHPQPAPPVINPPHQWCQFATAGAVSATASGSGDALLWYGPGSTIAMSAAPAPITLTAPDTIAYYVRETSSFGCISDSALDKQVIIKQPAPPLVSPVSYCQRSTAVALNSQVDSAAGSALSWYFSGTQLPAAPVPATGIAPGTMTWYVSQTVNTCKSDSAAVSVTIIYKPAFGINITQPWVCQYDSVSLSYNGPILNAPSYSWQLPAGASFAAGSHVYDDSIVVVFDSSEDNNYVTLTVADDNGTCSSDTNVRIKIVTQPTAQANTTANVCLGDTVSLALTSIAADATNFVWSVDYAPLASAPSLVIVRSNNSGSGGPFSISWIDSGLHIIGVVSYSQEGCQSAPAYDTVDVHMLPSATFKITSANQSGCIDDTVQFTADTEAYNDLYTWAPQAAFQNVNTPVAWGKIENDNTIVTLTVTDPFGCTATQNMEVNANSCCTVAMPNAFTPNGDGRNDFFRPLFNGYHHFQAFLIMNRWGQIVFNAENNGMEWNGEWNGVPQDIGTYYYYLKYDCGGKTIEQKGDVNLIK